MRVYNVTCTSLTNESSKLMVLAFNTVAVKKNNMPWAKDNHKLESREGRRGQDTENERARGGTHKLESGEGGRGQETEKERERGGTHNLERGEGRRGQEKKKEQARGGTHIRESGEGGEVRKQKRSERGAALTNWRAEREGEV